MLATHVSVPVTVQPAPQSVHVAPGSTHPSIYKPQLSDLKRLCQLMLDASSESPINLTPFDALFLDAEGLMELASCMQLKVLELATDMSNKEANSSAMPPTSTTVAAVLDNATNASGSPKGSRSSSEMQRLQGELHASRAELQRALSVINSFKERERQFELLQQQHSRTTALLTDTLTANEELKHHAESLKRQNAALAAPRDAELQSFVEKLSSMSQRNEKLAGDLQVAVRNFKSEMTNEKKQQRALLDSLRRKHERALLCQMRASVRSLRTIQERTSVWSLRGVQEREKERKASNSTGPPTGKSLQRVNDVPVEAPPRITTPPSAKELSHNAS